MAGTKNRQIRELIIKTETQGTAAATSELSGLEKLLKTSETAANTLNNSLIKTAGVLKSAGAHATSFSKGMKSLNTAAAGSEKRTKSMQQYANSILDLSDYMEMLRASSEQTSVALGKVNKASAGLSSSFDKVNSEGESMLDLLTDMRNHLTNLDRDTQRVDKSLDKLNTGIDNTNSAIGSLNNNLGKASGKQNKFNNGLKNQARHGNSATRAMSSLLNVTGPLTMAYAAVAANVYAVSESFRFLKEASDLQRLTEQVGNLSGALSGVDVGNLGRQLKAISGDALSFEASLRTAARAVSFNFTTDQITNLASGARKAAIALGIDFTDAMDRVTRGIAKQEVEVLDELGVVTRLIPAFQKYAGVLGKTVDQLTDVERQTALTNEVQKQLNERYSGITIAATSWERLGTATADATSLSLIFLQDVLNPMAEVLAKILMTATGSGARDFTTLFKTMNAAADGGKSAAQLGALAEATDAAKLSNEQFYESQLKVLKAKKEELRSGRSQANLIYGNVGARSTEEIDLDVEISRLSKEHNSYEANKERILKAQVKLKQQLLDKGLSEAQIDGITSAQGASLNAQGKAAQTATAELATMAAMNVKLKSSFDPVLTQLQTLSDVPHDLKDYKILLEMDKNLQDFNTTFNTTFRTLDAARNSMTSLVAVERQFAQATKLAANAKQTEASIIGASVEDSREAHAEIVMQLRHRQELQSRYSSLGSIIATQTIVDNQKEIEQLQQKSDIYDKLLERRYRATEAIKAANLESERSLLLQNAIGDPISSKATLRDGGNTAGNSLLIQDTERTTAEAAKLTEALRIQLTLRAQLNASNSLASEAEKASTQAEIEGLSRKLAMLEKIKTANANLAAGQLTSQDLATQSLMDAKLQEQTAADAAAVQPGSIGNSGTEIATSLTQMDQLSDRMDQLKARGLEGTEAFKQAQEAIVQSSVNAMSGIMDTAASLLGSMSKLASTEIDAQIAMIRKQEGSSYAAQQKIAELEKKRIKDEEKAALMSVGIHTAQGIMMAFGTQPWPIALGTSALIAAEGIIQSKTIKASAAGQMANQSAPTTQTVTVGEAGDASINLANQSSASEYAYATGAQGSYQPRFTGGSATGAASFMIGERGPEMFTPDMPGTISSTGDTGKGGNTFDITIQGQFLDGSDFESFASRHADKLAAAVEQQLQVHSTSLYS